MKFSEMPYQRPDLDAVKQQFADLCARFKAAESYAEARGIPRGGKAQQACRHAVPACECAQHDRHRDTFYDEEMNFWNGATPQLQECQNAWSRAMLDSPFRADFAAEYGDLMFCQRRDRRQGLFARDP